MYIFIYYTYELLAPFLHLCHHVTRYFIFYDVQPANSTRIVSKARDKNQVIYGQIINIGFKVAT